MSEQKIPIPAMLYNAAVEGHVTNSQQIIDENLNREQNDINQETVGAVPYNATTPNGMGRIVLKKTDNFKEVVEAQTNGNTIFVIKYDFTLTGDVIVPVNCVLEFDGGSVSNGTITFNNTYIKANTDKFLDINIGSGSTFANDEICLSWFKSNGDDCAEILTILCNSQKAVYLDLVDIRVSHPIILGYLESLNIYGLPSNSRHVNHKNTVMRPTSDWASNDITYNNYTVTSDAFFVCTSTIGLVNIEKIVFNGSVNFGTTTPPLVDTAILSYNALTGNIHYCDFYKFSGAAIRIFGAEHLTIENNTFRYCNIFISMVRWYMDLANHVYYKDNQDWIQGAINDVLIQNNYCVFAVLGFHLNPMFAMKIQNNYIAHTTYYGLYLINSSDTLFTGNCFEGAGGKFINISKSVISTNDNTLLTATKICDNNSNYNTFYGFGRKDVNGNVWRSTIFVYGAIELPVRFIGNNYAPNEMRSSLELGENHSDDVKGVDCVFTIGGGLVDIQDTFSRGGYGKYYPYFIHNYRKSYDEYDRIINYKYNNYKGVLETLIFEDYNLRNRTSFVNKNYNEINNIANHGDAYTRVEFVTPKLREEDTGFIYTDENFGNIIWNGKKWVDEKGFTPARRRGETSERPTGYKLIMSGTTNERPDVNGYSMRHYYDTEQQKHFIAYPSMYWLNNRWNYGGTWNEEDAQYSSVLRSGTTSQRPAGNTIYTDFEYFDTDINKLMYAKYIKEVNGNVVVEWAERVLQSMEGYSLLTSEDEGFEYFDTDLHKPIYAKEIDMTTGTITWVDATGTTV